MPPRSRNGWAFWLARSPCPKISTAWAKPRSRPCSGAEGEAPPGHPAPARGGGVGRLGRPMSRKRDVLDQLKRDELLAAVDRFVLEVSDRRVREGLVDALAGARRAGLAEILGGLSRDRLKEVCREM